MNLFVFRGNAQKRILESRGDGEIRIVPRDFLYGYSDFKGPKSHVLTDRPLGWRKSPWLQTALHQVIERPFARWTLLGLPLEIVPMNRQAFQKAQSIFCINDAISLSVLAHRRLGFVKGRVYPLLQSLAERVDGFRHRKDLIAGISWLLGGAEKVVTLSEAAWEPLCQTFGVSHDRLAVFRFGVDTQFWKPLQKSQARKPYILSVGNDLNRDYETLIEALPEGWELKLVSQRSVDTRGKRVTQLAGISDSELRSLYQECSALVVPSQPLKNESSGLSCLLQGLACGAPAIVSDAPPLRETFEFGKHCLGYEAANPQSLREALNSVLNEASLAQKLSQEGSALVKKTYHCESMGDQWTQLSASQAASHRMKESSRAESLA